MDVHDYIHQHYLRDLIAFRAAYGKVLGRDPAQFDTEPPFLINILEGDAEGVRKALRLARIERPLEFLVVTFLEGAFLAGVHAYDFANHDAYRKALPFEVFVENFPNLSVKHPQSILAAHGTTPEAWPVDDLRTLGDWTYELTRNWALEYDRLVASVPGSGRKILDRMAHDPDLAWGASWEIPEVVANTYMRELRRATPESFTTDDAGDPQT